ncbi:hypothetical protein J5N97_001374 [Dioscorea zingiberensis]|uniref:Pentatricopeptide repeat-containing protein n=1 Tax=Dioscorea zingiberensis TaxID=325984 RepID=A0A9D5BUE6_9LILI|nr:hypothetical protein J5N97_001374 [Dioscorea zingiberensis]
MAFTPLVLHSLTKFPFISPNLRHGRPFSSSLPNRKTFSYIFQECSKTQRSNAGKQAHAQMITSGFSPTIFVFNCLIHMYVRCSHLDFARKVFDAMPHRDTISWNAVISGYTQHGLIKVARSLFDSMPERDVISWNTIIAGYLQNGCPCDSISFFLEMRRNGIEPDRTTFAVVLKACSLLERYEMGVQIHCLVVKMGLYLDVVTGSAIVDMYAKCKCLSDSLCFFNEMPEKNWVSWSAAIAGCVQNDEHVEGLQMFVDMQREGLAVSQSAYASVLRSCAAQVSARVGSQIHGHAMKNCFGFDVVVGTAILDMYAKSGCLDDARRVFQALPTRTLQSWNAIIVGCVRNNQGLKALELFWLMNRSGVGVAFRLAYQVFSVLVLRLEGAHNAILDMYGKCGALTEARVIFEEMNRRDAVSWNAIIAALEQNERYEETLLCFAEMLRCGMEPDEFTYGSVLKACASLESLDFGVKVHDKIIKCGLGFDSFIGSALVDMYCKCSAMEEAMKLHNRMEMQTMISWNAITSGFSLQNQNEEAQKFFFKMINLGLKPDNFTFATILDACANLATIELGRQIHAQIIKEKLQKDVFILSSLVDMYAKCGNMQDSLLMFNKMALRDYVSWNALICGYSLHGFGAEALCMFERMQLENVRPNHATFLAVLRACGHVGLVDVGEQYFNTMTDHYKLQPQLEHYSCMVDLIGRTRGVHEALEFISKMPLEADDVIWRTLLSTCKIQGDVEVAEIATRNILSLDPEDSSAYILLSNIYAEAGRWTDVSKLRKMMRQSGLKKEPGCSWIEVKNEMHAFLVGDKAHPRSEEIYARLDELIGEMKWIEYQPDVDFLPLDFVEQEPIWISNG